MQRLLLLVIGLFFGGGFGFLAAATTGATLDGHDHGDPAQHQHGAEVGAVDCAAQDLAPTFAVAPGSDNHRPLTVAGTPVSVTQPLGEP